MRVTTAAIEETITTIAQQHSAGVVLYVKSSIVQTKFGMLGGWLD